MNGDYNLPRINSPKWNSMGQVIKAARENYCWIFHKSSRRWWTPDEFYDQYHEKEFHSIRMMAFCEELSIRDPRSGITAAFKQVGEMEEKHKKELQDLIDRIEYFNKKVITYYQEMSKPRL